MPANPRYLLVTDMWERGGQALLSFEHVVQLCITHNLVLVLPFVRDTQIQGMPGWTQWRAIETRHAMSFTAAKELFPLSDYLDIAYTQQFLPIVDFQEFSILSNWTITTAIQLDWMSNGCINKPEWYPAFGATIQATQFSEYSVVV